MNARPSNIILITTHDSGRHFGCYGHQTLHTPAIDRLAREGCRFARHFSVSPICSPSRASLSTGRYPQSHGVTTIINRERGIVLREGLPTMPALLAGEGFDTAIFGIQHESPDSALLGFRHCGDIRPRRSAPEAGKAAADFIRAARSPFFLQVGFFETHTPYDFGGAVPDSGHGVGLPPYIVHDEAARKWMAAYQGSVRQADRGVQAILEALDETGQTEDTLVIFTVDHGIELPRAKWFLYDAGLEVAFLCRWPAGGVRAGSVCGRLTGHIDVLPTLMEILGRPVPPGVQGASFAPLLLGRSTDPVRSEIFAYQNGYESRAVRTDRHKLILNFEQHCPCTVPGEVGRPRQSEPVSPLIELYDLEADPLERDNRADDPEFRGLRSGLVRKLREWMEAQDDAMLRSGAAQTDFCRAALDLLRAG